MKHDALESPSPAFVRAATETGLLVQRAQAGDTRAFDTLVRRFQDRAVGYGAALLGDLHLAEDAAQEAFLETYRILPALRAPDAFPAYLRLTVRKHCDRITRRKRVATVPLEAALNAAELVTLAETVEVWEQRSALREAVRALPETERVAVTLFYAGQQSLKEIAVFLEVPVSTVKNRLHAARRRLRERMGKSMDVVVNETLAEQRPSNTDRFRGAIISRLYNEYRAQFQSEMQTADRSLLDKAREELRMALNEALLDAQTAHAGIRLLLWTNDFAAFPELMDRYRAQSLPSSEEFWANYTRIRGLAIRGDAGAAVCGQRELMEWVRQNLPGETSVRLSSQDPFAPTESADEEALSPDTLPVFALGIVEIGVCYHEAGVFDEWLTMVRETIAAAPKTATNRLWRFYQLRHAVHLLAIYQRQDDAIRLLEQINNLAEEEEEEDGQAQRWPIEALYLQMRMHAETKNRSAVRTVGAKAIGLLNAYRAQPGAATPEQASVLRTLANNLAAPLTGSGAYDLALPLWEQIETRHRLPNEWSYLWYAECVWATTKNRERTLALLRHAAACRFDDELRNWFLEKAEGFADVREDSEFLAALTPQAA